MNCKDTVERLKELRDGFENDDDHYKALEVAIQFIERMITISEFYGNVNLVVAPGEVIRRATERTKPQNPQICPAEPSRNAKRD